MNGIRQVACTLTALTSVGLGGWYLGKFSEQRRHLNEKDNETSVLSRMPIRSMPGLPLFGTVSAATSLTSAESNRQMGSKVSSIATRVSQIMKFGFPGLDHVRSYEDFVLSYDRRNKVAHWVFEHLTKDRLQYKNEVDRSKCEFKPDQSIHPFFRSENIDYKGSGYDRGHLAAAGNHRMEQNHMEQTFLLSNMAPQIGVGFNRDSWNRLEKYVRKLTNVYKDVYVCTGPLYLPKKESDGKKYVHYEVIGANNVAVPTHFYKVIVGETNDGKLDMEAFVMPNTPINDNTPLSNFQVPLERIERAAGLLFFDKISRDKLSKVNGKRII
ncbi:endonuclease G, mitochondrial [Polyergus mexicanus]|uniref:endonuclease G, mitochondrial n=1 Tax=Polyergus mexicanus TaxID=615972 RepID=UPI0038B4A230